MLLLYENQQLVRAMQGWQAVDFETHGDRILIVESTPDDDPWYALVHRTSANDVDMGDMKPRRIHSANQWKYVGWIAPTVLEFEHIDATHRRERVDLATLKPDQ